MAEASTQLRDLLCHARPSWCSKELDAVQGKLERIGVRSVQHLLLELQQDSLNESLQRQGERRFAPSTLQALRQLAEDQRKKRKERRRSSQVKRAAEPCEVCSEGWAGSEARPLMMLSDAELWAEYIAEGVAPPSFVREDLVAMLAAVRSWREAPRAELVKLCRRNGVQGAQRMQEQELCLRLKQMTWEEWNIPVQCFQNDMSGAFALLEQFQELNTMMPEGLIMRCHEKGIPVDSRLDLERMKQRLQLMATWELLPMSELQAECYRRGLPLSPAFRSGVAERQDLLNVLIKAMHDEALAKLLAEESCADDEGAEDEDAGFVCLECGSWSQPDGEAAWVDGHKCCDKCAWRVYFEEKAKEAQRAEYEENENELRLGRCLRRWRECREPAPEPNPEVLSPPARPWEESEGEDERILWQHFDRGLKDQQPWSICDLPTDASEGEEQPRAPRGPRVETPLEPIARASQASVPPAPGEAPCLAASAARESPRAFPSACFCYASPLAKGLRELNVRAEWEAMSESLNLEVLAGTADSLQEVLLSKKSVEILHIAAHTDQGKQGPCLVLEAADGSPHLISDERLSELGWWDGIELLVLLACSSQSLVQRLIARGLRRAVCCSELVLDAASQVFCRTFYRALAAGQALTLSFEAAQEACRHAAQRAYHQEAAKFILLGPDWALAPVAPVAPVLWPLWPQVEDYLGRERFKVDLARLFQHRRAVCVWGDRGSGKTALCVEFCRFFSAPGGRRFSGGAFHVKVDSMPLARCLLGQLWVASQDEPLLQLLSWARRMELRGPWLLVLDGLEEERESMELLSMLLESTTRLHLLLATRRPFTTSWASLGYSKVVDLPLPELELEDGARLLARRARRPFCQEDFGAAGGAPLAYSDELLRQLRASPVMERLRGHPGRIVEAAAQVRKELPSLLQHPSLHLDRGAFRPL